MVADPKDVMSRTRLFLIDAALVVGGVVLLACGLMKIGEWSLGHPASSWGIPVQDWALAALCLLVFAGVLCVRALVARGADESVGDEIPVEPPAARPSPVPIPPQAPEPPARVAEVVTGPRPPVRRGNALERAAAAEERRQARLRAERERQSTPDEPVRYVDDVAIAPDEPAQAEASRPKPPRLRAVDPGGNFL